MERLRPIAICKVVLFAVLLTSCANTTKGPITFSIEQLGSEAATRNDEDLGYRSSVSITGISPPYATGKLLSVPGRKLPDVLSVPVDTTCSRIIETVYESKASDQDVQAIATAIEALRESLIGKAVADTKLQVLSNARTTFNKAKQSGTLDSEPLLKTFASALGVTTIDDTSLNTQEQAIRKEIDDAKKKADVSSDLITKLGSKPNVFIFRWAMDSERSSSTSISAIFSSAASNSDRRGGYLVAASLRSAALEYGDDLVIKLLRDKNWGLSGADAVLKNTYITNFTLGAKHHYFSEDRDISSAINAALKLSATELDQIFGGGFSSFLQAQSLAVEAALKTSLTASARGLASMPTRKSYPFRLWGDLAFSAGGDAERIRNDTYTTFYSTRSNLANYSIDKIIKPEGVAYFQCLQNVPSEGSIQSTSVTKLGFKFCSPQGWDTDEGRGKLGNTPADAWTPDQKACLEFDKAMR